MSKQLVSRYSRFQKSLHWIIAVLILWQFVSHFFIDTLPKNDPRLLPLQASHGLSGFTILLLTAVRLITRLWRGVPTLPETMNSGLQLVARGTHGLLYLLIIGQTVTGMMAGPGGNKAMGQVHGGLSVALLALILLHISAAIWHIQKGDAVGSRMFRQPKGH
jgi:cytochrome b561